MLFCQMQDGFKKIVENPSKCKHKGLPEVLANKGAVIKPDLDNPKRFFLDIYDEDTAEWARKEYDSNLNRAARGAIGTWQIKTELVEIPPEA